MEAFTVIIKSHTSSDKSRATKIKAEDTWLAHKYACDHYNELRDYIQTIKDSRNNEVYNFEKGFIFE